MPNFKFNIVRKIKKGVENTNMVKDEELIYGQYYKELPYKYFRLILNSEGGYVNDPTDRGGETNRGITLSALNTAKKQGLVNQDVTIKSLTDDLDSVYIIYNQNYYIKAKSYILPHPFAYAYVDATINHGRGNSGKFLQRTCNVFNAKIDVDGAIGKNTIAAVEKILAEQDLYKIIVTFNNIRESFYNAIVKNNPSQSKFLKGWMNRLNRIRKYCQEAYNSK